MNGVVTTDWMCLEGDSAMDRKNAISAVSLSVSHSFSIKGRRAWSTGPITPKKSQPGCSNKTIYLRLFGSDHALTGRFHLSAISIVIAWKAIQLHLVTRKDAICEIPNMLFFIYCTFPKFLTLIREELKLCINSSPIETKDDIYGIYVVPPLPPLKENNKTVQNRMRTI